MNTRRILLFAALASGLFGTSEVVASADPADPGKQAAPVMEAITYPPLQDWAVDSASFIGKRSAQRGGDLAKAAADRAAVYRPVAPCRLFDTRGLPAAIAVPGPFAPNTMTNINAAGHCGIPNTLNVSGLSVAISVENLTPANGGYIATQQQGAPVTAINTVLNSGAVWTGTTANIPLLDDSGNFSVYVANSQVHVIVDVNGYYQDLDSLDTLAQLDIDGNSSAEVLAVRNATAGGNAIGAYATGTGHALVIGSGSIAVAGMGVNTNTTTAFVHHINTAGAFGAGGTLCAGFPHYTVLNNIHSNGNPNALLLVTARYNTTLGPNVPMEVQYMATGCGAAAENRWTIRRTDNAPWPNGHRINVLIIKP